MWSNIWLTCSFLEPSPANGFISSCGSLLIGGKDRRECRFAVCSLRVESDEAKDICRLHFLVTGFRQTNHLLLRRTLVRSVMLFSKLPLVYFLLPTQSCHLSFVKRGRLV